MLTRDQMRDGRALLHWTAQELAEHSGIRRETIYRLEAGKLDIEKSSMKTVKAIKEALEKGGIDFLADGSVAKRKGAADIS